MFKKSASFILILLAFSLSQAQVPQVINYQGMLTDAGGTALNGSFVIEFKIYDAPTAGTALWTETQTVAVTAGLFDVLLGSVTPIPYTVFDGSDKYLSLKVGTDPEMTPRKRLVSVGYALRAYNADKVDGLDAAAFVQAGQANSVTTAMIQDNAVTAAKIAPNVVSSLDGVSNDGGNIDLIAGSNVTITPDDANNTITIAATPGSGGIGGSGTADYLSKFTGTTSIGNSMIVEKNNGLGIGTTTPDANCMLTIEGTQARPNGLIAIGHFGSTEARPAGIYAGLKSTSSALTGAGIYTKVVASENANISFLYGAQFGAVADATKPCRGASIGLEGNQISSDDYALELVAVDPGYALYCRDNGKAYFGGNVGIGTTSPTQKLDVAGTVQMTGFKLPTGAANNYVLTSDASGVGTWKTVPPTPDNDWTISGNDMYSAVSGNVGIGTNSPGYKLDVVGPSQITSKGDDATILMLNCDRPFAFHQRGSGVSAGLDLRPNVDGKLISISAADKKIMGGFWDVGSPNPDLVYFLPEGGNVGIGTTNPQDKLEIANGNLRFYNSADNKTHVFSYDAAGDYFFFDEFGVGRHLAIKNGGNIGIGTTNPGAKLHTVSDYLMFEGRNASAPNCPEIQIRETNSNSYWAMTKRGSKWSPEENQLLFSFYNGSTWFANMNLKTNKDVIFHGNVGIGTTTPDQRLTVEGAGNFNGNLYARNEIVAKGSTYPTRTLTMRSISAQYLAASCDFYISYGEEQGSGGIVFKEGSSERMRINAGGNVGIGNSSPSRILTIRQGAGRAIADGWDVYSSRRWKTNIRPINSALEKVKRLTGVTFDWKENGKHDLGLIAEDVGQVIPEVVAFEENGVDAQSVDYARLVALLIQGMKEQQATIDQLNKRITDLEKNNR